MAEGAAVAPGRRTALVGLAGWSGAGKTTLVERLVAELTRRGIAVSTVKHAHHAFDVDQPGKDSWRHRAAGAVEVMVASSQRFALMREHRGAPEPDLDQLVARMAPVDLILVEGFKFGRHDRIEIWREEVGKPRFADDDPGVVAVASDRPLPGLRVPCLPLDGVEAIADFIVARYGLAETVR